MSDVLAYQQALIDAGTTCAKAADGAVQAALATAGLLTTADVNAMKSAGIAVPARNLSDAAALASLANNAAVAAASIAQALDTMQTLPVKAPTGTPPELFPGPGGA